MRRNRPIVYLLFCLLAITACTVSTTTPQPTPPFGHTPTPIAGSATDLPAPAAKLVYALSPITPQAFGDYPRQGQSVTPQVREYDIDPGGALNADQLDRLDNAQRSELARRGFVIVPAQHRQFYGLYKQATERGQPVFVTTDMILHAYHILYDYTLRYLEVDQFSADLDTLNRAMLRAAHEQLDGTVGPVQEAARRNLAFFSVADILLNPDHEPSPPVADLVRAELALIDGHAGFAPSPIMGYEEDYSQYVPRGHYTRNDTLERYFRAMMWYGRIMFRLRPGDDPAAVAAGRRETRQALLITLALHHETAQARPAVDLWERIYEPTVFFVGKADDLTVYDYGALLAQRYGDQVDLHALNDDAAIDALIADAAALRRPQIVSSLVDDDQDPGAVTQGFRFMGQRFVPDSYILQQLVYDAVGTSQAPRLFPKGLDVPAALGSDHAYQLLDDVFAETDYVNYDAQLQALRRTFAALPDEAWTQNLYWNWLHTLRALLPVRGQGYPAFMRSAAWAYKDLNTFLGSWTELRHDTLLYAKQSYTLRATGIMPQPDPALGYVEPNPEAFQRLAGLITQMRTGLMARGLLNEEYRVKLERMEALVLDLESIARKELVSQPLSDRDAALLRNIGTRLDQITTFSVATASEITSEADGQVAVVADVHTDVNTGQVLEEAVGDVWEIYVLVPHADHTAIAIGGVFSYYEWTQPMSQRLTDEAWQAMDPRPTPAWELWTGGRE